jgi:hypothetical protein
MLPTKMRAHEIRQLISKLQEFEQCAIGGELCCDDVHGNDETADGTEGQPFRTLGGIATKYPILIGVSIRVPLGSEVHPDVISYGSWTSYGKV